MSGIRRGGYIFVAGVGDHGPRHVHVYRDAKLVVKWDLENRQQLRGQASTRVVKLIEALEEEGEL